MMIEDGHPYTRHASFSKRLHIPCAAVDGDEEIATASFDYIHNVFMDTVTLAMPVGNIIPYVPEFQESQFNGKHSGAYAVDVIVAVYDHSLFSPAIFPDVSGFL